MKALAALLLMILVAAIPPLFYLAIAICAVLIVALPIWFAVVGVPKALLFDEREPVQYYWKK